MGNSQENNKYSKSKLDKKIKTAFEKVTELIDSIYETHSKQLSTTEKKLHKDLKIYISNQQYIIRKEKEYIDKTVEWKKLNIAFFGETNAGKSTLIEALLSSFDRPTDGSTIGDGRKDFTKDVAYHSLSINNRKLTLIDLPGIEGDENGNLDDIDSILKKGLTKAHIIFYVYGEKKPEPETAKKIRKYASDQAIVYSVRNKRGASSMFSRIKKKNGFVKITKDDINNKATEIFKKKIGNNYKGDFIVHALSGYLAIGDLKREDFISYKSNFIKVFENERNLKSFSKVFTVEQQILKDLNNSDQIIYSSNEIKLNGLLNSISKGFDVYLTQHLSIKYINSLKKEISIFFSQVDDYNHQANVNCKSESNTLILKSFKNLSLNLNKLIDKKEKNKEVYQRIVNKISLQINEGVTAILKKQNKNLLQKINIEIKRMERFINININTNNRKLSSKNINFKLNGLEEMDINMKDVAEFFTACLGFLIGPWGGLISLGGYFGAKFIGDGGKSEAKSKVSKEIGKERVILSKNINSNIDIFYEKNLKNLKYQLLELEKIPTKISIWRNRIIKVQKELNILIKL